jgi:exopolyphosphatase/guanosine-5'-triphosphate,3'-diphosphate pyrophosphatase
VLGTEYRILSGDGEAEAAFLGAVSGVRRLEMDLDETHVERLIRRDVEHRATVIDVGGGSTEVVQGRVLDLDVTIERSVSMNVGSVRMTERHFTSLPPAAAERTRAEEWLSNLLDGHLRDFDDTEICIGSSGTPRILASLDSGGEDLMNASGGCPMLSAEALAAWSERLLTLDEPGVFALDPVRMRGRADVFPAAALILRRVFDRVGREALAVSSQGVRHGVAIRYFRENMPTG